MAGFKMIAAHRRLDQLIQRIAYALQAMQLARRLIRSELFDPAWYGREFRYGCGALGAALHYLLRGAAEGRSPSKQFDGDWYARRYLSVVNAEVNPLIHYLAEGRAAGLETCPSPAVDIPRLSFTDRNYAAWIAQLEAHTRIDPPSGGFLATPLPSIAVLGPDQEPAFTSPDEAQAILFVPAGVALTTAALAALKLALAADPNAALFYADEDRIDRHGVRGAPWFKPDWDPDLMLASDLTGPATLFRRDLLAHLGWDGSTLDAGGLRMLSLRAAASGCRVGHIPRALFHRTGTAPTGDAALVQAHLAGVNEAAQVVAAKHAGQPARIVFPIPAQAPLVSIIMPTRNRARLLRRATLGVLEQTAYKPLELLIVDNDSQDHDALTLLRQLSNDPRVRVLQASGAFNWSAMNNQAARQASGGILLLLNNDVEVISARWLGELVSHVVRPDVGAAGARLLYPDGTIQHAGISIGPGAHTLHLARGAPADEPGPRGIYAVTRTVAAVTGACLAIRRDVFQQVGGLDQQHLPVTNNDVDLCLRLRAAGYRIVYAPESVLKHHEAASRGRDASKSQIARAAAERAYLRDKWGDLACHDPYLNPNLCVLRNRIAFEKPSAVARVLAGLPLTGAAPVAAPPAAPAAHTFSEARSFQSGLSDAFF